MAKPRNAGTHATHLVGGGACTQQLGEITTNLSQLTAQWEMCHAQNDQLNKELMASDNGNRRLHMEGTACDAFRAQAALDNVSIAVDPNA